MRTAQARSWLAQRPSKCPEAPPALAGDGMREGLPKLQTFLQILSFFGRFMYFINTGYYSDNMPQATAPATANVLKVGETQRRLE